MIIVILTSVAWGDALVARLGSLYLIVAPTIHQPTGSLPTKFTATHHSSNGYPQDLKPVENTYVRFSLRERKTAHKVRLWSIRLPPQCPNKDIRKSKERDVRGGVSDVNSILCTSFHPYHLPPHKHYVRLMIINKIWCGLTALPSASHESPRLKLKQLLAERRRADQGNTEQTNTQHSTEQNRKQRNTQQSTEQISASSSCQPRSALLQSLPASPHPSPLW